QPENITASDIIEIIDGPITITDCVGGDKAEACVIEDRCLTRPHWMKIATKIRAALDDVTLAQLSRPIGVTNDSSDRSSSGCSGGSCDSTPGEKCACGTHLQQITGDKRK